MAKLQHRTTPAPAPCAGARGLDGLSSGSWIVDAMRTASSQSRLEWVGTRAFRIAWLVGALLLGAVQFARATMDDPVIRLFVDESKIQEVVGLKRVSITNPRIADVVVIGPKELRLDGLSIGRTTLYLWDQAGRKRFEVVVMNRRDDVATVIKEAINLPEISIQVMNNQVLLKGWVENEAQHKVATEVARIYQDKVVDLIQVKGQKSVIVDEEIRRILNLPEVKITVIYSPQAAAQTPSGQPAQPPIAAILLEGFVDDQRDSQRAEIVAQAYSQNVRNLIEVVRPLQVLVQAHLLELSVRDLTKFGFDWGTSKVAGTSGGIFTAGDPMAKTVRFIENVYESPHGEASYFGAKTNVKNNYPWQFENINRLDPLFLTVNWLLQNNKGKLLANPRIVCRSGENAEINVGGQLVYPLTSATGTPSTGFQPFGVILNITPNVDHKGNINTKLNVTVSNPDSSLGATVGGSVVPGLRTRTTRSEVSVKDGEHIVVSGLMTEDTQKAFDKVPYLNRLPILGNLFTSKDYQVNKTELVIVVTPNLMATLEQSQLAEARNKKRIEENAKLKTLKISDAKAKPASRAVAKASPSVSTVTNIADRRSVPPDPTAKPVILTADVKPHGADVHTMSERPANKTASGYAMGTEPLRAGEIPNPKVATLPPGDNTARGRMQAILGGMREQLRWRKDQEEMDRPIPPPPPERVHSRAPGGFPPNYDPSSARTYDSITPREALMRDPSFAPTSVTEAMNVKEKKHKKHKKLGKKSKNTVATQAFGAVNGAVIVGPEEDEVSGTERSNEDVSEEKASDATIEAPKTTRKKNIEPKTVEESELTLNQVGDDIGSSSDTGVDQKIFSDLDAAFDRMKEKVNKAKGTSTRESTTSGHL